MESVRKHHSKKFGMTATDHIIRFNTVLSELDLIESYERTQAIFEHLLNDVTRDMNEKDQVRFVLRSDQLDTPISIPFIPLAQLTTERVFSQIERVIQSNRDFRLNDTVTVDIIRVEEPQGSGRSKRTTLNIREYLKGKKSIITINNNDNLCLARALVVGVARIEKDPKYEQIRKPESTIQLQRAMDSQRTFRSLWSGRSGSVSEIPYQLRDHYPFWRPWRQHYIPTQPQRQATYIFIFT